MSVFIPLQQLPASTEETTSIVQQLLPPSVFGNIPYFFLLILFYFI